MVAEKLTVVQIVPEMDEGGVEGETLDFAIYLARNKHRSIVISGGGRMVKTLERNGVEHVPWKHIGEKSIRCLKYINKLRLFLAEEKVDILHLRSRLPAWIGFFAWKGMSKAGRPALITSFHGFYSINSYSTIMTRGERVIAVSGIIREHILENYSVNRERIKMIHGGYAEEVFDPHKVGEERVLSLRKKWEIQDNNDVVIMLPGRLTYWKGQDVFIEALGKIRDLPFIALCVGAKEDNTSYTKKLEEKISLLGLAEKVRLVGHCDDMPAGLKLADLVISASSSQPEAFGKVSIEAMAMEKPVIATKHGGSLETIVDGETGWLVPPSDPDALAGTLKRIIGDRQKLGEVGRRGRRWVQKNFTAGRMCEKTIDLYREIIREKEDRKSGKVLAVAQLLPNLDGGGVERGTLEMGKYLSDQGHKSYVISGGGRLVEQLTREGSRHIRWKIGSKSPIAIKYILPLRKFLLKEQIDVLHLRSRMPAWVGYLAWKTIPERKRPILVTTFHGFYSVNRYSAIMTKGMGKIAVSQSIADHLRKEYNVKNDISLIYRGVDKETFNPDAVSPQRTEELRKKWSVTSDIPVIMLPGRLTSLKGQDIFIKALSLIKNIDFQALIVGDVKSNQSFANELKEMIREFGLTAKIKLVGHCSDMPAGLLLADIVVSATSKEPEAFGRTTVEAMAMGKAVVVTAHGGSLETVTPGYNGWLVKPGDPADLARGLSEALKSKETLEKFGKAGKEVVDRQFTTTSMCEKTIALYKQLFEKHRRRYLVGI